MGTGDGRFVVKTAAAEPDALVIGLDASAGGLYAGLGRARKARLGNAVFAVASAERLPAELAGIASECRVQFPWGSLLHAVLRADDEVVRGIAGLLAPGGRLTVLLSVVERDGVPGVERLDERSAQRHAQLLAAVGDLRLADCRQATAADVRRSHSTWAKRLGVPRSRPAWVFELRRPTHAGTGR